MARTPVVGLEIGTSKVIAIVGELQDNGQVMITGIGEHPATGVRKGEIVDFENAGICVRAALASAEDSARVAIRQVHLGISGSHISSVINRGAVPVVEKVGEVTQWDIEQVMDIAQSINLPPDRDVLHTICQHFCIDEQHRVIKPEGMGGSRLSLDMLVIHGLRNQIHNAVKVVSGLSLDVQDIVFSGLCSGLSVLTPEQKQSGAVVIDIGGGTTDYLVYADNVVAAAGAIGVGGDHITNDIGVAFNIPTSQAEQLKRKSGSAVLDVSNREKIEIPAEGGFPGRSVDVRSLNIVINARVDETLAMLKKRLDENGILHHVGAGILLTGGGAWMRGVSELTEKIFGLPCSIGKPVGFAGLAAGSERPQYATCSGLVQYGFRTPDKNKQGSLGGWLKGLFGG
ncbi:MAG: cell division protein FtsA [Kiritimatiellae bacterium]|nr:cell division protein FtsA [Kiritimatiellia bacterium]